MLKEKMKVNQSIRKLISDERIKANKSGTELSGAIGKSDAWISLLENGRIKTINLQDFVNIIITLLDCTKEEAEKYIETELERRNQELQKNSTQKKVNLYSMNEENIIDETKFKKVTDNLMEGFEIAFENEPEYTFKNLIILLRNLHADMGFTLGTLGIPFYMLENVDDEVKKQLFKDIGDVVKKYLDEYAEKVDDSEDNNIH